jgi:hypothetical protein
VILLASFCVSAVVPNAVLRADSFSIARWTGRVRREGHRVDFEI